MVICRLAFLSAEMEKFPLSSVTVPLLVPATVTVAPLRGLASASVTVPLTVDWANAVDENNTSMNTMITWLACGLIFNFSMAVVCKKKFEAMVVINVLAFYHSINI